MWKHTPASSGTPIGSDIDPYPIVAAPIGLLASFAINPLGDAAVLATDETHKENATWDDDDVVRVYFCLGVLLFARRASADPLIFLKGVAGKTYFMPGPALNLDLRKSLVDRMSPPDILVHKLVTPDDVEKLFDM